MPSPFVLRIATSAISLILRVHLATAPATLGVLVRLEPDTRNRAECVTYDSQVGMVGTDCWPVAGANAPRVVQRFYPGLSEGDYLVEAWVIRADRSEAHTAAQRLEVH